MTSKQSNPSDQQLPLDQIQQKNKKMWGGRFQQSTNELVEQFSESISFDARLYEHDIHGSIAHATMLTKVGVLTQGECDAIISGLEKILADINANDFSWSTALEDIHMNIESRLTKEIGEAGKKLHTGRSRNDQVATDIRLYLRDCSDKLIDLLAELQTALLNLAEPEVDTIMPGFTHLQVAQPISFAHHMLAWIEMLQRDKERVQGTRQRINIMPLGSAALAGTSFPIDRSITCELLGFDAPTRNSLDAVSDRDFAIEFASNGAILMMHLSRMCEEIILWMSEAYKFIEIGDAYCTGSSIMPQKKNPDIAELVRGKSARVYGDLTALLTLMKSQPLAYNRDNQEDKEPLFDVVDTLEIVLPIFTAMIPAISVQRDNMYQVALSGYATATDLAEYLVRKNVPFRDAHKIVGNVVNFAINQQQQLSDLALDQLQSFGNMIEKDVFEVLSLEGSIQSRNHFGGTAPKRVAQALQAMRESIKQSDY